MHLPLKHIEANYVEIARERYVMAFSKDHPLNRKLYPREGETYPYIDPHAAAGQKFVLSFPYQRVRQISDRILEKAEQLDQKLAKKGIGRTEWFREKLDEELYQEK